MLKLNMSIATFVHIITTGDYSYNPL